MIDATRPTLYYLWKDGENIQIRAMTDVRALELYNEGERWHGVPFNTQQEAEEAVKALLAEPPPQTQ